MFVFYILAGVLVGILIIVHEVGHFLAARATGVRVERFSIGFGPKIFTVVRGHTEYALSVIPLGGYVKMAGTETSEHATEHSGPDTFPGKPIGARAFIVAAGPVGNFVWALLVYIAVVWIGGLPTVGDDPVVGFVEEGSPAQAAGVEVLDRVTSVEGEAVDTWDGLRSGIMSADAADGVALVVERGEGRERIPLVVQAQEDPETGVVVIGIGSYIPPLVGDVMRGSPADLAGLTRGDRVVEVDGVAIRTWYELQEMIAANPGQELRVAWERGAERLEALVVPDEVMEPVGTTEVRPVGSIGTTVPLAMRSVGPGEAIVTGARVTASTLVQVVQMFWMIATGQISMEMVGGPIRVVQMASESARWGPSYFFAFMAFLSLNLTVLNLLPLPILDGGHLLLLALERVRHRGLTERQLMVWQQVGLVFFVGLAALMLIRDVFLLR
jgi:regulator of sigma E protease